MNFPEIHEASASGDLEMIRQLYATDHDCINALDGRGGAPLHSACFAGEVESARLLIEYGANVHLQNHLAETPLHEAAKEGWSTVVELLLAHGSGADIEIRSNDNATPLFLAASRFSLGEDAAKLLLQHGAMLDLNSAMWLNEFTFVLKSLENSEWRSRALDPDTLIHQAVVQKREDLVRRLLDCGIDVNAKGNWQATPLSIACCHDTPISILELLLEHGAAPNSVDASTGKTPLGIATQLNHIEQVQLLRKYGGVFG